MAMGTCSTPSSVTRQACFNWLAIPLPRVCAWTTTLQADSLAFPIRGRPRVKAPNQCLSLSHGWQLLIYRKVFRRQGLSDWAGGMKPFFILARGSNHRPRIACLPEMCHWDLGRTKWRVWGLMSS